MAIKKSELYSSLWKSCDELRGGMDASQYKDYVLILLFVKYVSDKYAGDSDALIDVPAGGSFADMVAAKGDKEIGDKINKIIGRLADANDSLKGAINVADFNDEEKLGKGKEMVNRLTKLVAICQTQREMVNGESHYFFGQRYRLRVREQDAPASVAVRGITSLDLFVGPGTSAKQREAVLLHWYREQLRALIPPLLEKWQPILGVQASHWYIRKMKTKWGSCNPTAKRLWFNLELAKKPVACLEYIVVHELVHLLERNHTDRFTALMDLHLSDWQSRRATLNAGALGHEQWNY